MWFFSKEAHHGNRISILEIRRKMPGNPQENDDYWRPPWETEDDDDVPPGAPPRGRKAAPEPDFNDPLLTPLARAQDAVARLEAKLEMVSDAVAEGLRARMSYLEGAGWLRHVHVWIHPWDLALRDAGLTTSYGVARFADRLATVLPSTVAQEPELQIAPSDIVADQALRFARHWWRLAELRTWRPLADAAALRETLQKLGGRMPDVALIDEWLDTVHALPGPPLIRAGRAARDWMNLPGSKENGTDGLFLAACVFRGKRPCPIALPFWSAPEQRHHRLGLKIGVAWMAEFLECVTAAAAIGLRELERLRAIEDKARSLGRTARSRLPAAVDSLLRAPIVTAGSLAKSLAITPEGATGLLRQLTAAGLVREATGRASWRAFALI
jgi:HTH DNA binding domain